MFVSNFFSIVLYFPHNFNLHAYVNNNNLSIYKYKEKENFNSVNFEFLSIILSNMLWQTIHWNIHISLQIIFECSFHIVKWHMVYKTYGLLA